MTSLSGSLQKERPGASRFVPTCYSPFCPKGWVYEQKRGQADLLSAAMEPVEGRGVQWCIPHFNRGNSEIEPVGFVDHNRFCWKAWDRHCAVLCISLEVPRGHVAPHGSVRHVSPVGDSPVQSGSSKATLTSSTIERSQAPSISSSSNGHRSNFSSTSEIVFSFSSG